MLPGVRQTPPALLSEGLPPPGGGAAEQGLYEQRQCVGNGEASGGPASGKGNIQSPLLFVGKGERNTNLRLPLLTRAEKTAQKSTRTVTPEPGEGSGGGSGRGGALSLPLFWEPCGFLQSHVFPNTRKITHQAASETYELNQIKRPLYQG